MNRLTVKQFIERCDALDKLLVALEQKNNEHHESKFKFSKFDGADETAWLYSAYWSEVWSLRPNRDNILWMESLLESLNIDINYSFIRESGFDYIYIMPRRD